MEQRQENYHIAKNKKCSKTVWWKSSFGAHSNSNCPCGREFDPSPELCAWSTSLDLFPLDGHELTPTHLSINFLACDMTELWGQNKLIHCSYVVYFSYWLEAKVNCISCIHPETITDMQISEGCRPECSSSASHMHVASLSFCPL